MKTHILKTWPEAFAAVMDGRKKFDFRKDDRGFEVGDVLKLREWEQPTPTTDVEAFGGQLEGHRGGFTGLQVDVKVTYILRGPAFGIPVGYVIMSIENLPGGTL